MNDGMLNTQNKNNIETCLSEILFGFVLIQIDISPLNNKFYYLERIIGYSYVKFT